MYWSCQAWHIYHPQQKRRQAVENSVVYPCIVLQNKLKDWNVRNQKRFCLKITKIKYYNITHTYISLTLCGLFLSALAHQKMFSQHLKCFHLLIPHPLQSIPIIILNSKIRYQDLKYIYKYRVYLNCR